MHLRCVYQLTAEHRQQVTMKLYIIFSVVFVLLVQLYLSQAESNSATFSGSNRLKRSLVKRLHKQWGKRDEVDSDELYQRILRALFENVKENQRTNPVYLSRGEVDPLTLEQLLANRHRYKFDTNDPTENLS